MIYDAETTILLNETDYRFINEYMMRNKIPVGKGNALALQYFLNEYKRWLKHSKLLDDSGSDKKNARYSGDKE